MAPHLDNFFQTLLGDREYHWLEGYCATHNAVDHPISMWEACALVLMHAGLPFTMLFGGPSSGQFHSRPWLGEVIGPLRGLRVLDQAKFGIALLLLAMSVVCGGTSGDFPGRAMTVELIAVASLGLTLATWSGPRPSWAVIGGLVLVLGLPLLQLIPLPPEIWQNLPGRESAREIAAFIDAGMWRPVTLDSSATMKSWLSLFVPVAMFLAVLQLRTAQRMTLCFAVIAAGVGSLVLGMIQMAAGGSSLYFYDSAHNGLPLGFFSNRNHQAALFYVSAIVSLIFAKCAVPGATIPRTVWFAVVGVFIAGIFATESRAGVALLCIGLILAIPIFLEKKINWPIVLAVAASISVFFFLLSRSGVVQSAIGRFALLSSEGRYDIWPEAWVAARSYFPAGSGMGTFVKAYQAMEDLTSVTPYYINHAHNDYLELMLEFGVLAFLVLTLFVAWYGARSMRIFREPRDDMNLIARVALIAILMLLLHSVVDYPIRTFGHMCIFGMLCGFLYRPTVLAEVKSVIRTRNSTDQFAEPRVPAIDIRLP